MLRLAATTEKLQAVLGGAVSATQPQAVVCYSDQTASGYSGGKQLTALNSTTDVDILAAPAASTIRDVDYLSIFNRDSASVTVTIKYDISGTDSIITTITLATLETLFYTHASGWLSMTAGGAIKTPGGSVSSVALTATPTGVFDVSGSPITTSGTLALSMDNQSANIVLAGPASGAAATPAFRALNIADGLAYSADGRLTLTSATPVLTSDVTASTSIFYALYKGNKIALYDGTVWTNTIFTELTNTTTDNTKNPAAVANNSNYDLFVWSDSGTLRLGRGPAWTSDTGRGTGAGTTELERVNGIWVNKIAITNGPAAQRGHYVGTVRSNGSAQIDFKFGTAAANGGAAFLGVWNMYNRTSVGGMIRDTTDSWSYSTNTWRSANNSTSNRLSVVVGLNEDTIYAEYLATVDCSNNTAGIVGVGLDVTNNYTGISRYGYQQGATAVRFADSGAYNGFAGLGFHFLQAVEYASLGTVNFFGDSGGDSQVGMSYQWRC